MKSKVCDFVCSHIGRPLTDTEMGFALLGIAILGFCYYLYLDKKEKEGVL